MPLEGLKSLLYKDNLRKLPNKSSFLLSGKLKDFENEIKICYCPENVFEIVIIRVITLSGSIKK